MPSAKVFVKVEMRDWIKFTKLMNENPHLAFRTASQRLKQYWIKRFIALSSGGASAEGSGGGWVGLAENTIKKKKSQNRKYGISTPPERILMQTGTLIRNIDITREGNKTLRVGIVRAGRAGPVYSALYKGKRASQIAAYHQYGRGRNPKRVIINKPSSTVMAALRKDIIRDVQRAVRNKGK